MTRHILRLGAAIVLALSCTAASPQANRGGAPIYSCIDDQGRRLTRDRYIAECSHKEQYILNADGSVREVVPPTLTPDERARRDEEARKRREDEQNRKDAVKADRLLLQRYPDKPAHDHDREGALADSLAAIQSAEARLRELADERKRLLEEAEFYRGRLMPPALKQRLDNNEAAAAAQRNAIANSQAEQQRINAKFDIQLERLRQLWGGAKPGTLGPPVP
jgi:hypothetical protein